MRKSIALPYMFSLIFGEKNITNKIAFGKN